MQGTSKWTIGLVGGVALGALLWTSIGIYKDQARQQRDSKSAIALFHQHFNSADFDTICREVFECAFGSPFGTADDGKSDLGDLQKRYGTFQRIVKSQIQIYSEPPFVHVEYISEFERGELRELFLLRDTVGPLTLIAYKPEAIRTPTSQGNEAAVATSCYLAAVKNPSAGQDVSTFWEPLWRR
jgi:hypothetical protein